MDVSFKGITNVGAEHYFINKGERIMLAMHLDNKITKDLAEFKKVVKECNVPNLDALVKLDCIIQWTKNKTLIGQITINDKLINLNKNNIKIFEHIAKICSTLSENLSKTPDSTITQEEYLKNCTKSFLNISSRRDAERIYKFENVKNIVDNLGQKLSNVIRYHKNSQECSKYAIDIKPEEVNAFQRCGFSHIDSLELVCQNKKGGCSTEDIFNATQDLDQSCPPLEWELLNKFKLLEA